MSLKDYTNTLVRTPISFCFLIDDIKVSSTLFHIWLMKLQLDQKHEYKRFAFF